jgi:hypothetical protein
MTKWSRWQRFPDPRMGEFLHAPLGAGVYQLRNRATGRLILFGIGKQCANRMSSLLPKPLGCGTRNNEHKRQYVLDHLTDIEYRCIACTTRRGAEAIERQFAKDDYLFVT